MGNRCRNGWTKHGFLGASVSHDRTIQFSATLGAEWDMENRDIMGHAIWGIGGVDWDTS